MSDVTEYADFLCTPCTGCTHIDWRKPGREFTIYRLVIQETNDKSMIKTF